MTGRSRGAKRADARGRRQATLHEGAGEETRIVLKMGLFRHFEAVPDAAQGFQILRMAGIALDLLAQSANVNVDGTRRDEGSLLPNRIEELIASQNPSAVVGEIFEQAELPDGRQDIPDRKSTRLNSSHPSI